MKPCKRKMLSSLLAAAMLAALAAGCASDGNSVGNTVSPSPDSSVSPSVQPSQDSQVAASDQMAPVEDVVEEGMTPIPGSSLQDGTYSVTVDSSSSMFSITSCELTVENGVMTAVLHMGGTGYQWVYPGTAEQAAAAQEDQYIPYEELSDGTHTFTIPVQALDQGIPCAAFSANKALWYDRTLLFRADSLPLDAFQPGTFATAQSLGLADGSYTVEVQLTGGSGKATVASPAALRVENGAAWATLVWNSSNYDYMMVDGEQYLPLTVEGGSTFEIPVACFDWNLPVVGDTVAMGTPHEIEYVLYFDSASITAP